MSEEKVQFFNFGAQAALEDLEELSRHLLYVPYGWAEGEEGPVPFLIVKAQKAEKCLLEWHSVAVAAVLAHQHLWKESVDKIEARYYRERLNEAQRFLAFLEDREYDGNFNRDPGSQGMNYAQSDSLSVLQL